MTLPQSNNKKEPLLLLHNEEITCTSSQAPAITLLSSIENSSSSHDNCCSSFLYESVWPGLGLLGESYMLFSIGTMKPIWQILYPDCFAGVDCSEGLLQSLTITVVLGVMMGMLCIGYAADFTGRRVGSILTASLMTVGALGLTALAYLFPPQFSLDEQSSSSDSNAATLLRCMSACLFIFGIGVGGEYPLAASSASERAMQELMKRMEKEQQNQPDGLFKVEQQQQNQHLDDHAAPQSNHSATNTAPPQQPPQQQQQQESRGRRVQLVFTMQGVGIFCNSIIMTALLIVMGQTGNHNNDDNNNNYDMAALLTIWRVTYAIGAAILSTVLVTRIAFLTESEVWQKEQQKQQLEEQAAAAAALAVAAQATTPYDTTTNNAGAARLTTSPVMELQRSSLSDGSSVSSLSAPSVEHQYDQILRDLSTSADDDDDLKNNNNNQDPSNLSNKKGNFRLLIKNFGMRLIGASASWMLWDVAFYGNKLFQSSFLLALTGENTTLLEFAVAATLNAAVALLGYFGAAAIIDHPLVGRRNLQQWGLLLTGSLFVLCGICYDALSSATLVTMYLGSSFFGQLGPNATTFLLPAEIFPTQVRTLCHGIAAASGKFGALMAATVFHYVSADMELFMISGYASFAACAITFWTIPETTGLDLYELDRKWHLIVQGRKAEYVGQANHPRYLSNYEVNRLKMQKNAGKFSALDAVH